MISLLIAGIGTAVLAVCVWSWRGRTPRSRWWLPSLYGRQLMLDVAPGLGTLVLGGGLLTAAAEVSETLSAILALVVVPPMLIGFVLVLAGIVGVLPKWWGPKWYRDKVRTERRPRWNGF